MSATPCKYDAQHSGLTANQIKETKPNRTPTHSRLPLPPLSHPLHSTHMRPSATACAQEALLNATSGKTSRSQPPLMGVCVYGKHHRPRGPARAYSIRYREAGPSRRSRRIRLGSPIMWDAHGQDIRLHGRRPRPEASVCTYGKPDRAGSQC